MEELNLNELRKKKRHVGIRLSDEELAALEEYCQREQISKTDFFRIGLRKVVNEKESA